MQMSRVHIGSTLNSPRAGLYIKKTFLHSPALGLALLSWLFIFKIFTEHLGWAELWFPSMCLAQSQGCVTTQGSLQSQEQRATPVPAVSPRTWVCRNSAPKRVQGSPGGHLVPSAGPMEPFLCHTDLSLWDPEWREGAILTHRLAALQRLRLQ